MILNDNNINFLKNQTKRRITLNEYVKAYYDCNIIPYSAQLDTIIKKSCDRVFEITDQASNDPSHKFYYPKNKRINEYGNHVENVLCAAIEEITGNKAKNLGVGYPDVATKVFDYHIYPECKISSDISDVGSMRSFYTTTPAPRTKKIKNLQDGIHLLFKFEHDGPGRLTGRYKVWDLNGLEYTAEGSLQQGNAKDIDRHCKLIIECK